MQPMHRRKIKARLWSMSCCDPKTTEQHALIRLSLWSVIDGHGGGIVATYAAQVLLPHITASISHSLDCDIVQQGECRVNNELREDAIDFQGLLQSSGKSRYNANSIHYSTPKRRRTIKQRRMMKMDESCDKTRSNRVSGTTTANTRMDRLEPTVPTRLHESQKP